MNHKEFWAHLFAYYQEPFNEFKIELCAYDTKSVSIDVLKSVWEKYRKEDKFFKAPPVSIFLESLKLKEPDCKELGKQDADQILACVKGYGHTEGYRAQTELSKYAWDFVMQMGGWYHVCEYLGTAHMPINVFLAQGASSCENKRKLELYENHNETAKALIKTGQKNLLGNENGSKNGS